MGLHYENLDAETRQLMVEEIEADVRNGTIYISSRLSPAGERDWVRMLLEAAGAYDDDWLAGEINSASRLKLHETARTPSGGTTVKRVPYTAAETMAEGEFNRFYVRALCRRALNSGVAQLTIYRAKQVANARSASQAMIGASVDAGALLADLRTHQGIDTALGLPPGPNSGLSAKLP